jgi:hypothetical protein
MPVGWAGTPLHRQTLKQENTVTVPERVTFTLKTIRAVLQIAVLVQILMS